MNPSDYLGKPNGCRQGKEFTPSNRRGFLCLPVLPFLIGKRWDEVTLGYVQSLRPTHLRVVTDGIIQLDSQTWRVTVYLNGEDGLITGIEQEVEIGLPDGVSCGSSMEAALHYGIGSPQVAWHNLSGTKCYGRDGVYNMDADGVCTPYPESD